MRPPAALCGRMNVRTRCSNGRSFWTWMLRRTSAQCRFFSLSTGKVAIGRTAFPHQEYRSADFRLREPRKATEEVTRVAEPDVAGNRRGDWFWHFHDHRYGHRGTKTSIQFGAERAAA